MKSFRGSRKAGKSERRRPHHPRYGRGCICDPAQERGTYCSAYLKEGITKFELKDLKEAATVEVEGAVAGRSTARRTAFEVRLR